MERNVGTRANRMPLLVKSYGYNKIEAAKRRQAMALYGIYLWHGKRFFDAVGIKDTVTAMHVGSELQLIELQMRHKHVKQLDAKRKYRFNVMCVNMNVTIHKLNTNKLFT
jgi:hypothetical protein